MAVKAIIFDCFGVLVGGSIEALMQLCAPDDRVRLRDVNKQHDYGFIDGEQYVREIAEILGWSEHRVEQFLAQKRVRNNELINFVAELRQQNVVKIALLSNVGSKTLEYLFEPGELEKLFEVRILSFEESLAKPNPEIFKLAAERLNVEPGECVMIDDRAENCEGAEIAGMLALQHTSNALTIERIEHLLKTQNHEE